MEKDIALGTEGQLALKLEAGMLIMEAKHVHASGEAAVVLKEDVGYFLDKIAALIPGQWDDAAFALVKQALKGL